MGIDEKLTADEIELNDRSGNSNHLNRVTKESQAMYRDYREWPLYSFLYQCDTGTGGFSGKTRSNDISFIVPNRTELTYATRVRRSIRVNFYSKYLRSKYKDVYSTKELNTTVVSENDKTIKVSLYYSYVKNITRSGMTKDQLNKNVIHDSWRDAVSFIVTDSKDGETYSYKKQAGDVIDYGTDSLGNLQYIIFYDKKVTANEKTYYYARYWGVDSFKHLRCENMSFEPDETTVMDERENTLVYNGEPFLPVKAIYSQVRSSSKDVLPVPDSYQIASLDLAIWDRGSVLDNLIDKQGHALAVFFGRIEAVPNGINNALALDDDVKNKPFYLEPSDKWAGVHQTRINTLKEEMFDLMDEGGIIASQNSNAPESGISKAYTFKAKATTLDQSVRMAKECDRFHVIAYKAYNNDSGKWTAKTDYTADFNPKETLDANSLMNIVEFFYDKQLFELAENALKRLVSEMNPDAEDDEINQLNKIIEAYAGRE